MDSRHGTRADVEDRTGRQRGDSYTHKGPTAAAALHLDKYQVLLTERDSVKSEAREAGKRLEKERKTRREAPDDRWHGDRPVMVEESVWASGQAAWITPICHWPPCHLTTAEQAEHRARKEKRLGREVRVTVPTRNQGTGASTGTGTGNRYLLKYPALEAPARPRRPTAQTKQTRW